MEKTGINTQRRSGTYALIIDALFIALTFVATWQINIRLPLMGAGGLIHLGNVPLFIAAFLYGRRTACLAGSIGMALFDLMSGWTVWAPFTFVIVGLMGYCAGLIEEKRPFEKNIFNCVLAVAIAVIIKIVGYYFAEVILYGNWVAPFGSIPGNIIQVTFGGILVVLFIDQLKKIVNSRR